jgi:hypothetical protein
MLVGFAITDHLCRKCGIGRVLYRRGESGEPDICRCSNCGVETDKIAKLCFCGHVYPSGIGSRVKCVRNQNKTPAYPHEVVLARDDGVSDGAAS